MAVALGRGMRVLVLVILCTAACGSAAPTVDDTQGAGKADNLGGGCTSREACTTLTCVAGECVQGKADDQQCASDAECQSNVCAPVHGGWYCIGPQWFERGQGDRCRLGDVSCEGSLKCRNVNDYAGIYRCEEPGGQGDPCVEDHDCVPGGMTCQAGVCAFPSAGP